MKLKNKKTGEIVNAMEIDLYTDVAYLKISKDGKYDTKEYGSIAELTEEWEDASEEPKWNWFIDWDGEIKQCDSRADALLKFETKEEAEKAVEKLKAFKRLKDEGMSTYSFHREKRGIDLDFYTLTILAPRDKDSLDLLFGDENERVY